MDKRYDQYPAGTYTTAKIFLQADATTGALEKVNLPAIGLYAGTGSALTSYTTGDLIYASASNVLSKLPIGSTGDILKVSGGGIPSWSAAPVSGIYAGSGTAFTTYATGDMIIASSTNTLARLAAGTNGQVLTITAGSPAWAALPAASGWSITGNAGTSPSTNFIGTTDNQSLKVSTNSIERLLITTGNKFSFASQLTGAQTQPARIDFGTSYGNSTPGSANNLKWVMYGGATPSVTDFGIGMIAGNMEFQSAVGSSFAFYPGHSSTAALAVTPAGILSPFIQATVLGNSMISLYGAGGNGFGIGALTAEMRFYIYDNTKRFAFYDAVASGNELFTIKGSGQIGISNNSPAASAKLDITSTTQGFLPPRMTTTQKNAISSPAAGLIIYDSTLSKLCVYTTAWETITSI